MTTIHHITTQLDWDAESEDGFYRPSSLKVDGFIHCSRADQTVGTANLYYRGQAGLLILCIDEEKTLAEIKYEAPTGGPEADREDQLFPHLYGPLNRDAVVAAVAFPCGPDGSFEMPTQIKNR